MKKGILYVRVSDIGQVNGTSLDNQERACRDFAVKNDIEVVRVFIEKGESATAANRTEFLKALEFCRAHKGTIHAFIVWKIDRFARNTTDHFAVRAQLTKYGVTLQSVTEPITQDHIGKLMETFLAGYAEFENEVRKQRCTGGMQGRLRGGVWCWSPPIGYMNSKRIKDRRKTSPDVPDEERFYFIQKGLLLYRQGNHTITALAKESEKWELRTRTGRPMGKQLWETILTNKFYAGILVDPWTGEEYQGLHKPMISLEEYKDIQRVKKQKSNNATAPRLSFNPDFPLRPFVRCECGSAYTASWSKGRKKRYALYHCHNRQCNHFGHSVPKDVLEGKFRQLLVDISPSPKYLELLKETVVDTYHGGCMAEKQENDHRARERSKLEMRRKELLEMRVNREISSDEYIEMKGILENHVNRLNYSGRAAGTSGLNLESVLDHTIALISNLANGWQDLSSPLKMRLQNAVLPKGITYQKSDGTFGTAVLSPILGLNKTFLTNPSGLVAEVRQNWNQIISDMQKFHEIVEDEHGRDEGMR